MALEYPQEETTEPHESFGTAAELYDRINTVAEQLGITAAGAYFQRKSQAEGTETQMVAMRHETDDTIFFAWNHTQPTKGNSLASLIRIMDAFLVDPACQELAYLQPTYAHYTYGERWSRPKQGPLIDVWRGLVSISHWDDSQLALHPAFSLQPNRLEHEKAPNVRRASELLSRLSTLNQTHKQDGTVFRVGM